MDVAERTYVILKALSDPVFFCEHPYFLGMKLFPKQAAILRQFYSGNYRELVLVAGMRSGKTVLASCFALYELFKLLILPDPAAHYGLAPGSLIFVVAVAVSEEQARDTIFHEIVSKIPRSPFFREFRPKIYANEVRFPSKNVVLLCGTSSSASIVGRNVKCAIFDELARFEESTSKRGAWQVYTSLKRGTATFGKDGIVIVISSPRHTGDIVMQLYERSKRLDHVLGLRYATWEFNPRISFEDLQDELKADPISFWRDFGAQPLSSLEVYFRNPEILPFDSSITNVLEALIHDVELETQYPHVLAGDPALRHDAFGLATGFKAPDGTIIIDGMWRFSPEELGEINPIEVKDFIKRAARALNVEVCVFDTWNYPEAQTELRQMGLIVENHVVRKEDYDRFRELCYQKSIRMCDYEVARTEFENLRIVNARRIDHPVGGSKDVADAVVNCVWALTETVRKRTLPLNIVRSF